jgi:hypothetical protein
MRLTMCQAERCWRLLSSTYEHNQTDEPCPSRPQVSPSPPSHPSTHLPTRAPQSPLKAAMPTRASPPYRTAARILTSITNELDQRKLLTRSTMSP